MRELLDTRLPRIFPGLIFQCVPHEGKNDLDRGRSYVTCVSEAFWCSTIGSTSFSRS